MSEERFDGIEQKLIMIDHRFDAVDQRLDGIDKRFDGVDQRFNGIDKRLDGVDQRFDALTAEMKAGFAETRRHAGVLLEEAKDLIRAIPEYSGPSKTEFAELRDLMERRVGTLEKVVRQHGTDISELKRAGR
jgi:tetrahydromethanopterin S-methyltransferase subunit G